jgi:hypothetical protein
VAVSRLAIKRRTLNRVTLKGESVLGRDMGPRTLAAPRLRWAQVGISLVASAKPL